ncbi:cysteine rich repeat protein [Nitrospirillum amazonense]|uniref:Cysteine rich repeat protein n=1 Tax=Nitrospirillum amazonense TaxID=28077 RepID=A0A560EJX1_9PROT|nr:cysteine rich repeat-containing protein [Nitrospirillum amazonense]TWB09671.1 cysteine rich repeat protein [Nitrospirillum amazonense]
MVPEDGRLSPPTLYQWELNPMPLSLFRLGTGRAVLAAFVLVATAAPAHASDPVYGDKVLHQGPLMEACGDDFDKLCEGVKPGDGRVFACLRSHYDKLSAPCQTTLTKLTGNGPKRTDKPSTSPASPQ